jgi:endonuclease YncB( thermonuclease family)
VRLYAIDAPERSQPGGTLAWVALRAMIQGRDLACTRVNTDRYGRTVATCTYPGEGDIGAAMVRQGWAWCWPAYSDRYCQFQEQAKADGIGVWATLGAIAPWQWRARTRP